MKKVKCTVVYDSHLFLDYSLEEYKKCVQVGFNVGANIYGVYVSGGVEGGSCDGLLNEMGGEVLSSIDIL